MILLILLILLIIVLFLSFPKAEKEKEKENDIKTRVKEVLYKNKWKVHGNDETKIYTLDNFLTNDMCDKIIEESKDSLSASTVTRFSEGFRTSKTSFKVDDSVDKYLEQYFNIQNTMSEKTQIQYYDIGNEFKPHHDWFDKIDESFIGKQGQRTWTIMVYLNNTEEGGTTDFTHLGLSFKPKKGSAVVWYNLKEDKSGNIDTMHTGRPVIKGEKWIITKWIRSNSK